MHIATEKSEIKFIPIDLLVAGEYQPRKVFQQKGIDELVASIAQVGILLPLIVRPLVSGKYEILAGERRWRAAQQVRIENVPCIIKYCSDEEAAQIALIENLTREDLKPLEEAEALHKLVTEFGFTHEELAKKLGKSREDVSNTLRLLNLEDRVKQLLRDGLLTKSHSKILLGLPLTHQYVYAIEVVSKKWSTQTLEKIIKQAQHHKSMDEGKNNATRNSIRKLERQLSDQVGHGIQIDVDKTNKGWLKIKFNHLDELDSILAKLGYQQDE